MTSIPQGLERHAMDCINLQQKFGTRYRITFDPSYSPKHVPRDKLDPWMMQIPCQRGVVYPYGGDLLAVEVEDRAQTRKKLRELECTTSVQEGHDFTAVTFAVAGFDEIAAIVKPRRRRQISEKERKRLQALSVQYGFKSQLHQSARS
jgi:hypothetical protein